jgi:glutamate/tyrosine decarboxylase-like PLP-dependent enzyme
MAPEEVVAHVTRGLEVDQVHTSHPGYFGLFNPAPTTMGVAADTLVAAFNPQLASWSHSPFANAAERHVIQTFGSRFGYAATDGTFTSGGTEANHTAVLTALTQSFPQFATEGLTGLRPVLYVSEQAHHSFHKAARVSGLGAAGLREVPVGEDQTLDVAALTRAIEEDRRAGKTPFMVVGTRRGRPAAAPSIRCPVWRPWLAPKGCGSTWTRPGEGRPFWSPSSRLCWPGSNKPTPSPSMPISGCRCPWGPACT